MIVEFSDYGGDGERKSTTLEAYISYRLEVCTSYGVLESASENSHSAQAAVARLVALLVEKGVLSLDDVSAVVGGPWVKDGLALPVEKVKT